MLLHHGALGSTDASGDRTAECGYELRRRKRGRNNIGERYVSGNLGYEPITFESFRGIE